MLNLGSISFIKSYKRYNFNQRIHRFLKKCIGFTDLSICRQASHESRPQSTEANPFFNMMNTRREQAKRSILVQVQSPESFKELYSYCNSLGNINQMLHYTTVMAQLHFMIVEFTEEVHVADIIKNSSHINNKESYPIHSNFLWFKASNRKGAELKKDSKLITENGNEIPTNQQIVDHLQLQNNISEQIQALLDITKLNDVATRLRFLTTRQVELSVSGMFPHAVAYPFGSSVNGFGKMGCDLDIVFKLATESLLNEESRLVFHCKAMNSYERSITQRHMEVIGDLLQLFLPGCTQIRKILQARVPIIKYYQQFTDVECDLSMSNMSGVCMSDLLYLFGSIDARVCPLVFTIRKWAHEVGITNSSPGRWISNFSLTLLVIAFLQKPHMSPSILPSVNTIFKELGGDKSVTEDGVRFTFLKNTKTLNFTTTNTDSLESLLKQFFDYYSSYDFSSKAINLNEAISINKPEHSALYIVNPLERGLNVSKNVSPEELEKFKFELRNAAWILESQQEQKSTSWGILELFQSKKKSYLSNYCIPLKHERLMDVTKLFDEEENLKSSKKNFHYEKARR